MTPTSAAEKKVRMSSSVVLKDRFPIHIEFCLVGRLLVAGLSSFCFLDAGSSLPDLSAAFFFCRRFSACDRAGTSSAASASDSDEDASESEEDDSEEADSTSSCTDLRFLVVAAGEEDMLMVFHTLLLLQALDTVREQVQEASR